MKKRLFIAIPLGEDVKRTLRAYRDDYPRLKAKWSAEENLHITLYFCGDTDESKIPELMKKLENVKFNPFPIEFQGVRFVPANSKPPRMLWAVFKENEDFTRLVREIYHTAKSFPDKAEIPQTPPQPHITLARLRDSRAAAGITLNQPYIPNIFVKKFNLIESQLRPQGPKYINLQSYEL